jgi:hypothetical protein
MEVHYLPALSFIEFGSLTSIILASPASVILNSWLDSTRCGETAMDGSPLFVNLVFRPIRQFHFHHSCITSISNSEFGAGFHAVRRNRDGWKSIIR